MRTNQYLSKILEAVLANAEIQFGESGPYKTLSRPRWSRGGFGKECPMRLVFRTFLILAVAAVLAPALASAQYCTGCTISGGPGNDILYGTAVADTICGKEGDDSIYGGAGHDTLCGEPGNDYLFGDSGNDELMGWANNDTLDGWTDNDTLDGTRHDDYLLGYDGNDSLYGANDSDQLFGEGGYDYCDGDGGTGSIGTDTCNCEVEVNCEL